MKADDPSAKSGNARQFCFRYGVRTDVGMRRDDNQDAYGLARTDQVSLFIVADGMGGAAGGERASFSAVSLLSRLAFDKYGLVSPDTFREALRIANEFIYTESQTVEGLEGMGTTVVMVGFVGDRAILANVGDSRIYWQRGREIARLTRDHTLVQQLVDLGEIDADKAESHPMAHMLTRSLGPIDAIEADIGYLDYPVKPKDCFILCCDGLYNHVEDSEIAEIVDQNNPADASEKLVQLANSRGGTDNITVEVIEVASSQATDVNIPKSGVIEISTSGRSKSFEIGEFRHSLKEVFVDVHDKCDSKVAPEGSCVLASIPLTESVEIKPSVMTDGANAFDNIILGNIGTPSEVVEKEVEKVGDYSVIKQIPVSQIQVPVDISAEVEIASQEDAGIRDDIVGEDIDLEPVASGMELSEGAEVVEDYTPNLDNVSLSDSHASIETQSTVDLESNAPAFSAENRSAPNLVARDTDERLEEMFESKSHNNVFDGNESRPEPDLAVQHEVNRNKSISSFLGFFLVIASIGFGMFVLKSNPQLMTKIQEFKNNFGADQSEELKVPSDPLPSVPTQRKSTETIAKVTKPTITTPKKLKISDLTPKVGESKTSDFQSNVPQTEVVVEDETLVQQNNSEVEKTIVSESPKPPVIEPPVKKQPVIEKPIIEQPVVEKVVEPIIKEAAVSDKNKTSVETKVEKPVAKLENPTRAEVISTPVTTIPVKISVPTTIPVKLVESENPEKSIVLSSFEKKQAAQRKLKIREDLAVIVSRLDALRIQSGDQLERRKAEVKDQILIVEEAIVETRQNLSAAKSKYQTYVDYDKRIGGNIESLAKEVGQVSSDVKSIQSALEVATMRYSDASKVGVRDPATIKLINSLRAEVSERRKSLRSALVDAVKSGKEQLEYDISEFGILLEDLEKRKLRQSRQVGILKSVDLADSLKTSEREILTMQKNKLSDELASLNKKLSDSEEEDLKRSKILRTHGIK